MAEDFSALKRQAADRVDVVRAMKIDMIRTNNYRPTGTDWLLNLQLDTKKGFLTTSYAGASEHLDTDNDSKFFSSNF